MVEIRDLLLSVADARWGPRLQAWVSEFDSLTNDSLSVAEHVRRTNRAVAGMGSIGDVVICKEAGHMVPEDSGRLIQLNSKLQALVHSLFLVSEELLKHGA